MLSELYDIFVLLTYLLTIRYICGVNMLSELHDIFVVLAYCVNYAIHLWGKHGIWIIWYIFCVNILY